MDKTQGCMIRVVISSRFVRHLCVIEGEDMQIFGTKKCNDTKKAERFFKERGIKFQFIDMKEKGECRPVDDVLRIDRAGRRE